MIYFSLKKKVLFGAILGHYFMTYMLFRRQIIKQLHKVICVACYPIATNVISHIAQCRD